MLNLAPKNAVINDINSDLINLYLQIRDNTDTFIERVRELDEIDCTNEIYLEKRRQYNEEADKLNKAALMMWLNKRCFNGLYRVNKKGEFNSSYGKKDGKRSSFDESNLREVAAYLSNVEIKMGDFYDVAASAQAEILYILIHHIFQKVRRQILLDIQKKVLRLKTKNDLRL